MELTTDRCLIRNLSMKDSNDLYEVPSDKGVMKSVHIEKKHISDEVEAAGKLAKQLSRFLQDNTSMFASYDTVKIYYDNGQIE